MGEDMEGTLWDSDIEDDATVIRGRGLNVALTGAMRVRVRVRVRFRVRVRVRVMVKVWVRVRVRFG